MKYSASSVWENKDEYDVVVVGAGHAGCEAALATARLGFKTVIFTVSVDSVALMPCNPNIGGSSKGHLVRELDALGGEMGKVIDQTFIQSKMLNSSKGPAVHSLRAQADKANYSKTMRQVLQNQENLDIRQMEVTEILAEDGKITGVQTYSGAIYRCKAVVLCTGTYLKARCIYGEISTHTGPNGLQSANYLTDSLKALGIKMYRFKTGTPARIDKNTIDFSKMQEQKGDERVVPFSFTTDPESVQIDQASCWLTYTNETTHEIIRGNLDRSPLYSGAIEGTGPRYCPSIEDKVVKFYPKQIAEIAARIKGLEKDIETVKQYPKAEDKFNTMTIDGFGYFEKEKAGNALIERCKKMTSEEPVNIGDYRGFSMELSFDSFQKLFYVTLVGSLSYKVELGTDVFGNIQRIDNAIDGLEKRLEISKEELANTNTQFETAKAEAKRPFPQEAELQE